MATNRTHFSVPHVAQLSTWPTAAVSGFVAAIVSVVGIVLKLLLGVDSSADEGDSGWHD